MSARIDLTGQKYGLLVVIERLPASKWRCQCTCGCGKIIVVAGNNLKSGNTRSCGSLQKKAVAKRNTTHGLSKTPTYQIWKGIKNRCLNQNDMDYHHYGGRGITLCDRWATSFEAFLEEMGARPANHSIDRIDVNGNYEPSNCQWATQSTQVRNRRNAKLSIRDVELIRSLAGLASHNALAKQFGVAKSMIYSILRGKTWKTE
jgi:hypothetical protein